MLMTLIWVVLVVMPVWAADPEIDRLLRSPIGRGCPAFLLNIEKRSLPRLMLSGDGLASKEAV